MEAQTWLRQQLFEWTQPGRPGQGYVLMAGGEEAGGLRFRHWSYESAEGETPFGRWTFKREGFWKPRYVVIQKDTGEEVAVYSPRWSATEGTLQTGGGGRYTWGTTRFFGSEHALCDESGRRVFVLTRGLKNSRWSDIFKQQGTVRTDGLVRDGRTLSILMLFAWWMTLVQAEEAAGAAVVVMG